jgi:hypothetical protein
MTMAEPSPLFFKDLGFSKASAASIAVSASERPSTKSVGYHPSLAR